MAKREQKGKAAGTESYPALAVVLIVLAAALPIVVLPGSYLGFVAVRQWLLVCASLLALAVLLGYWLKRKRAHLRLTGAEIPWVSLLLALSLSTLLSRHIVISVWGSFYFREGLVSWISYFIVFLAAAQAFSEKKACDWLVRVLKYAGLAIAAYGILQFMGGDPLKSLVPSFEGTASSFLGNPAYLGGYLALVAPLFLCLAADPDAPGKERRGNILVFAFLVVAVILTESRASWVALAVVTALVIAYALVERGKTVPRALLMSFGGALLVVLILFGLAMGVSAEFRKKMFSSASNVPTSTGIRANTWLLSLSVIADKPLFGHGMGTYEYDFPAHINDTWEKAIGHESLPDDPHNVFVNFASSAGVVGLALMVWLLVSIIAISARRLRHAGRRSKYLMGGFLLGGLAYLVHLLFQPSIIEATALFWMFVGCAMGMQFDDRKKQGKKAKGKAALDAEQGRKYGRWAFILDTPLNSTGRLALIWLALLLTVVLLGASAVFLMRPMVADVYMRKAMDGWSAGEQESASEYAARSASWDTRYGFARLVEGRMLYNLAVTTGSSDLMKEAEDKLESIVDDYPDWEAAATTLGYAYLADFEAFPSRAKAAKTELRLKGKRLFESIVRRDPAFADAQLKLARFELYSNTYDRAINRLKKVMELEPGWPEPYTITGYCYLWKGENDKAAGFFARAKELSKSPSP